jgi:ribosomal-protein-alanine N-acetyltransferase
MNDFNLDKIKIHKMNFGDLDQVHAIEVDTFPTPWSKSSFLYQILRRKFNLYIVAKKDNEVLGYAGMDQRIKEGHITTIAVKNRFKRKNIGTILLVYLIKEAIKRGLTSLYLEVRESNKIAQEFYRKFNFSTIGRRIGYYSDTSEDALIMVLDNITNSKYKDFIFKIEIELLSK